MASLPATLFPALLGVIAGGPPHPALISCARHALGHVMLLLAAWLIIEEA
jgi:hypothetical protein